LTPNDAQREQTNRLYEAQALANRERGARVKEAFDKALLTLSAGALGVSLAFIKDVAPLSTAICLTSYSGLGITVRIDCPDAFLLHR